MAESNYKSPHILNASSNLLGLSFIVLTSIHILGIKDSTFIDDVAAFAFILFLASSVLSFISLRSKKPMSERFERIADITFMSGLFLIFITAIIIVFNIVK